MASCIEDRGYGTAVCKSVPPMESGCHAAEFELAAGSLSHGITVGIVAHDYDPNFGGSESKGAATQTNKAWGIRLKDGHLWHNNVVSFDPDVKYPTYIDCCKAAIGDTVCLELDCDSAVLYVRILRSGDFSTEMGLPLEGLEHVLPCYWMVMFGVGARGSSVQISAGTTKAEADARKSQEAEEERAAAAAARHDEEMRRLAQEAAAWLSLDVYWVPDPTSPEDCTCIASKLRIHQSM
eukprot:COSAG02_NODE_21491_length_786_cov_0.978166_1_plen_236_part_01